MPSLPSPVRTRKPAPPVSASGRLVTGIGVTLADLFHGCAILEITDAKGEEVPYWCGAVTSEGRIVGVTLQKFGGGEAYQVLDNGEGWECSCPDHVYRGRDCKHLVALHHALTRQD